jgi:hypothetical protein
MSSAFAFKGIASEGISRQQAIEDVLWALMNSKEFLYNH